MKVSLVRIGNSQGVRIPKPIIAQAGLTKDLELEVRDGGILLSPIRTTRSGWDAAFARMHDAGDDALLDRPTSTKWDDDEWEWS